MPRTKLLWRCVLLASLGLCGPSYAQAPEQKDVDPVVYSKPLVFRFVTKLTPQGDVNLANGTVVNAANWPTLIAANILTQVPPGKKLPICTATMVGPNVILMAAHCIDNPLTSVERRAQMAIGPRILDLMCKAPKAYLDRDPTFAVPRGSEDFALCLLLDDKKTPNQFAKLRFEVVEWRTSPAKGEAVLMTGYGCSQVSAENRSLRFNDRDGQLRIADQSVDGVPVTGSDRDANYLSMTSLGKEAMLCPGDSGGPLFTGATVQDPEGRPLQAPDGSKKPQPRRIRGVNSKVMPPRAGDGAIVSDIAATSWPRFKAWADQWIADNSNNPHASRPVICGVNVDPGDPPCRP